MSAHSPMPFTWDGEAMVPLHPQRADKIFVIGERYNLVQHEERSAASHNHYFAALNEAWQNLPEALAARFPTVEHLRKFALIKAGYHNSSTLVCLSKAEARRLAAFIRPLDEFGIVDISGATVTRYTAKSQSLRAMGRKDFQESKDAVLNIVADMIGVTPAELTKAEAA